MTKVYDQVELYVSCRPQRPPQGFCVRPEKACILQACGLAPGQSVPVLKCYGDDQSEPARDLAGTVLELTADAPSLLIALPGNYKLDVSALAPDPCVYITEQCVDAVGLGGGSTTPFEGDVQVDLQPVVDCLNDLKEKGSRFVSHLPGYCLTDTGEPVVLTVTTVCAADGTQTTTMETSPMATNISPMGATAKTCERVDTLPFEIVGPAAAQTYTEILTASLAAAAASYPTFGDAAATDAALAMNAYGLTDADHMLHNGAPTPQVVDEDGVNMANTIEVPEGCTVRVTFCLQKCLTKAEIAAL